MPYRICPHLPSNDDGRVVGRVYLNGYTCSPVGIVTPSSFSCDDS